MMQAGLFLDIWFALTSQPWRTGTRVLGLALGIAGIVVVNSISASSARQVDLVFEDYRLSTVVLDIDSELRHELLPGRLDTVAGIEFALRLDDWSDTRPIVANEAATIPTAVYGVSSDLLLPEITTIDWHRPPKVGGGYVIVGREWAGLSGLVLSGYVPQTVEIDGISFTVAGVLEDSIVRSDMLFAVLADIDDADEVFGVPQSSEMIVITEPGYAEAVARVAPAIFWPVQPERVRTYVVTADSFLREAVSDEVRLGGYVASAIVLIIAAASLTTAMASEVRRRTSELGLRRALGASGRQILILVISETAVVGLLAGIAGCWVGVGTVYVVALALDWIPVVNPLVWVVFPAFGAVIGALAGIVPARVAASISPRAALIT